MLTHESLLLSLYLPLSWSCPIGKIHSICHGGPRLSAALFTMIGLVIRDIRHAGSRLCAIFLAPPLLPLSTLMTGRLFFPTSPPHLAHPMPLYTIFQN
jgi:hypothetical protein